MNIGIVDYVPIQNEFIVFGKIIKKSLEVSIEKESRSDMQIAYDNSFHFMLSHVPVPDQSIRIEIEKIWIRIEQIRSNSERKCCQIIFEQALSAWGTMF